MARLLGDRVLPSTVQQQRRRVRERVTSLREPLRRRRAQTVPGPNVLGSLESRLTNLRDQFVTRDGVISRIQARRNGDDSGSSGGSSSNGDSESSGSRGSQSEQEVMV